MKKIAIGILMLFLWVNLSLASDVFDLFIKKDNTQEMREQYRIEREKAREERRMREKQKKDYQANQTYTPQSKKELIALLRKPKILLQNIDVSQIKDMSYLFDEDYSRSDLSGIEDWDVRATKISFMFSYSSITKLPKWYVQFILKHPTYTPQSREELEQILRDGRVNLAEIDVAKIQDFSYLFRNSHRDLLGIEFWDISGVENLERVFMGSKINVDLSAWKVGKVKNFYEAFAETPFNQNISDWDVSKEANVERVFFDSELEREDKIPAWAE